MDLLTSTIHRQHTLPCKAFCSRTWMCSWHGYDKTRCVNRTTAGVCTNVDAPFLRNIFWISNCFDSLTAAVIFSQFPTSCQSNFAGGERKKVSWTVCFQFHSGAVKSWQSFQVLCALGLKHSVTNALNPFTCPRLIRTLPSGVVLNLQNKIELFSTGL